MTDQNQPEYVVLIDDNNQVIGRAAKDTIHTDTTPLHRGFSLFLFNQKGQLLLQQRSHHKITWPLTWSNSCCGHPRQDETSLQAAKRRAQYELGLSDITAYEVIDDYRYIAQKEGIVENEICPIVVGFTDQSVAINPLEVEAIKWIDWSKWLQEVKSKPDQYSPWCVEETLLLAKNDYFQELLTKYNTK